jgi:PAS domain S-box-containing protein
MQDQFRLADTVLEQLADAIICADRSGAIIRWNRSSTALFGYSSEEALGQSLDLIIPERLRARHWSGFDTAITSGGTKLQGRPTLTRAVHKSGRKLYVEMSFAIVRNDADCKVIGAAAMARDVTERVERNGQGPTHLESIRSAVVSGARHPGARRMSSARRRGTAWEGHGTD